jgi:hypothetical protein
MGIMGSEDFSVWQPTTPKIINSSKNTNLRPGLIQACKIPLRLSLISCRSPSCRYVFSPCPLTDLKQPEKQAMINLH